MRNATPQMRARATRAERLLLLLLFVAVAAMNLQPVRSMDFWHHVAAGRMVAERGRPAEIEPFSHTAYGQRWIQYEWLAQLLFYLGHAHLRASGLVLLKAAAMAAAFLLLALGCVHRGAGIAEACLAAAAAAMVASARSYVRPEIFTVLLFAAFVLIAVRARLGNTRPLLLLPFLMCLWVNLHGAFAAGLAFLMIVGICETVKKAAAGTRVSWLGQSQLIWREVAMIWAAVAACFLATFANPYGPAIWHVPLKLAGSERIAAHVAEWRPVDPVHLLSDSRYWGLHLLLLCAALTWRRIEATDLALLLIFGGLAVTARRHIWLFALVNAPMAAKHLRHLSSWAASWIPSDVWPSFPKLGHGCAAVLIALMCWTALGLPRAERLGIGVKWENYPVGAAEFILQHKLTGNLFNSYGFGNYLLWRLHPENRVFIDGRIDVYGAGILQEYTELCWGASGWEERLRGREIRLAVLESRPNEETPHEGLLNRLFLSGPWRLIFWDRVAAVFMHEPPADLASHAVKLEFEFLVENFSIARVRNEAEWQTVMAHFERLIASGRADARVYANLGLCHKARGSMAKAAEMFRRLVELEPKNSDAHSMLAESLLYLNRHADAEKAFLNAVRLDPRNKKAWHNLGNLFYLTGRYRRAIAAHARAWRLAPNDWRLPWMLSYSYEQLGQPERAAEMIRATLRLRPDHEEARKRLENLPAQHRE